MEDEIVDMRDYDILDSPVRSEEEIETDWEDFLSHLPFEQRYGIEEIVDEIPDYRERHL